MRKKLYFYLIPLKQKIPQLKKYSFFKLFTHFSYLDAETETPSSLLLGAFHDVDYSLPLLAQPASVLVPHHPHHLLRVAAVHRTVLSKLLKFDTTVGRFLSNIRCNDFQIVLVKLSSQKTYRFIVICGFIFSRQFCFFTCKNIVMSFVTTS